LTVEHSLAYAYQIAGRVGEATKAIQELLGHSWLSTTTRYVNPRELHQAGEFLQVA
jgi:site-specific recombinase XerD